MSYVARLATSLPKLDQAGVGFALVVCENRRKVRPWQLETKPEYTVLLDEERQVARDFGVYKAFGFDSFRMARPSAFLIDRERTIRYALVFEDEETAPSVEDYIDVARARGLTASAG
jgi:peroxiredoxin Q/BCP